MDKEKQWVYDDLVEAVEQLAEQAKRFGEVYKDMETEWALSKFKASVFFDQVVKKSLRMSLGFYKGYEELRKDGASLEEIDRFVRDWFEPQVIEDQEKWFQDECRKIVDKVLKEEDITKHLLVVRRTNPEPIEEEK